ncbi:MAG: helix-turn-helix domain-containing protein [Bacteroidetes bacterium]|nr:helix-turn-helix domain-containing protein [Bacteroidota bacterium]
MKHISILVPRGELILSSVIGPYKIFNQVNDYLIKTGQRKEPMFDVKLVGLDATNELYGGAFTIRTDALISEVKKTDLIIIPASPGDIKKSQELNKEFVPWLQNHYKAGTEIASLCTGAFLLASTGLLNGRSCATHWMAVDAFRQTFTEVKLTPEKILTDDRGIYSSAGAYSFLNLILYLVEKYCGREVAIFCSKLFQIEIDRNNQSPFILFQGQKDHGDDLVKNAQQFIESQLKGKITVEQLAAMSSLSKRNFERRFKKATANTPVEYLQRARIEVAKKSLETTRENINEVMYSVGYSDSKAFRTVFKKVTGLSPLEYRNRYNREALQN